MGRQNCNPVVNESAVLPIKIVIFAKAPKPRRVKTRLIPALGAEGAAKLAGVFLHTTVNHALAADVGVVEICASPDPEDTDWLNYCEQHPLPSVLTWSAQGEGDLGERMHRAVMRVNDAGAKVLLIGADCPGLTADKIRWAAKMLGSHPAVMIPATDGGYVLLGVSAPFSKLFTGMVWSSSTVADETRQRLREMGLKWVEGEALSDIDEPEDLHQLPEHLREHVQMDSVVIPHFAGH